LPVAVAFVSWRFFCCNAYLTIFAAVKGEVIGVKPFAEIFSAIWRGSAEQAIETESNSMQPIAG